jgi:hypothetical protein
VRGKQVLISGKTGLDGNVARWRMDSGAESPGRQFLDGACDGVWIVDGGLNTKAVVPVVQRGKVGNHAKYRCVQGLRW